MAQEEEADDEELFDVRSPASPRSDAAPQTDRDDNIRVFVRVRPPNVREDLAHLRDSIVVDTTSGMVQCLEPPRRFAFDGVLGHDSPQEEVFELLGQRVAEHTLSGYNGSIYVYGQTGSGKTYTMQGAVDSVQSMHHEDKRGLMCRILDYIFAEISRRHVDGSVQHSCKCSYLEIYKEQITDLLEPSASNLQIREDTNRGVYVERLSEHSAWSSSDAFHVVWKGLHQRHVAATQMNELSSRSHAVFTLKLEASSTTAGGVTSTKVSRLNLIDLAGSERQSFDHSSPHESLRVKEAGAINRSLSALTNVIMSLSHRRKPSSAGPQRQPFVRYRDSKLTFLLRDSLGGNSKTVIVGCVSPSALCFGETLSTLKFAARAKHIRCSAVMNEEYSGTVESLMLEVRSLRQQLDLLSSRGLLAEGEAHGKSSQCASKGQRLREEELALEALVAETLDAAGTREDLQSLYGPRRVRRLEILLAAVLERERRCELRRHKMDKYSQYLNTTLERKEQYFDALRSYFSGLVDYAAGEACYLPEFTARLVLFRQQLANAQAVEGRQSEMLAGTIEAFLVAEEGLLNDGNGRDESPSGLCYVSTQNLLEHEQSTRSRSYSYGYLLGEAARRSGRRSTSHMKQLASSSMARLPGAMAIEESSALGEGTGGPVEAELAELRAENKLLRRQLESHPELYRLSAENRLLREHMAMLVQQKASHQEPDFYWNREMKEHRPEKEMSLARTTSRLLSTEKEEPTVVEGGSRFELKHFPGIEEVTRLSSSGSESELEAPCREDRGSGEVTSFLPAMARQVQELFRVKDAMEESLRQHLRARRSRGAGARDGRFIRVSSRGEREVPVDAAALAEALQGATQALQNAEAMVAKGSCGDLFVGIDEGGVLGDRVCSEGMDERDVFLSLMRSLPGESHALRREGVLASSVPQLPRPGIPSRCRSGSLESSSTGGGCLQRMKSTMQLHRIVEAPSLQEIEIESPARQGGGRDPPGGGDEEPADTPGDRLQLTIQQVQNLSKQLESIGEIHKEVKSQLEPMQQEYLRRLEEVRFLEAQCRRLDVHCRRLEELTVAAVRTPRERREGTGTPRAVRTSGWCQATLPAAQAAAPAAAQPMVASGGRFIPVASRSAAQTVAVVYDTQGLPQRSASWTMLPTRTAAPKQGSLQNLRHEAAQAADAPVLFSPSQEMLRRVYSAPQLQVSTERMFQSRVEGHVSSRHYGGARAEDPEAIRPPGFGWAGPDARQGLPTGAAFVTRFEATRGRAP